MKIITRWEFRNNSATVMDSVPAAETYHITRNGQEVAELRPRLTAPELAARRPGLPRVELTQLRAEADALLGGADRIGDEELGPSGHA